MGHLSNAIAIRLGGTQKWFLFGVAASSAQYKKFFLQVSYNFKIIVNNYGNLTFPIYQKEQNLVAVIKKKYLYCLILFKNK
jgi:hypothetical protein